ncbi:hypothetical protein B7R21_07455 [Subtercola boreus]|uniref:Uncharacterized protein n=2 Tax=Subtercola boreus TaxID=120213 RepID=A0A3E0VV18_9MICO|nr:hypothetical protein B7R21_07455 [Subtercola boreus]
MPSAEKPATALQAFVDRGHRLAKRPTLRRADVAKLFGDRDEGKRVMALAIIQKRPELGSFEILVEAVGGTRGAVEHGEGLSAALAAVDAGILRAEEVDALKREIRGVLEAGHLGGSAGGAIAKRILDSEPR